MVQGTNMKRTLTIFMVLSLLFGITACGTSTLNSSGESGIVIPAEPSSGDRVLPDLPTEIKYEDFIGEFPENYYLEMSKETLTLLTTMLGSECSEMAIAETPVVSYFKMNIDGVLMEVVDEKGSLFIRKGGKGSFSKINTDDNAEAYTQLTDGLAELVNGMRLQYSFTRDNFDDLEIEALKFDKIGGRDCIVYRVAYEDTVDMVAYLDLDTKVCLKMTDNIDNVDIEFSVFKSSDFTIPKYK